jgi:uncharacterized protein
VLEPGQSNAGRQFALGRFLRHVQIGNDDDELLHAPLYSPQESVPGKLYWRGSLHTGQRIPPSTMKFTLEGSSNVNLIRSYSAEEIRIGEHSIRSSCIVMADALIANWPPAILDELQVNHLEPIFELRPELVLLGTGGKQRFAPAGIRSAFAARGIGVESMDLGAACRTFNILVQEERRVAAALFLK